mmetsp:Transcript_19678/g.28947  ORF Transcript_19678/g.28947 Transcript_19678/m.28947 type:complete len:281 (+) Transcript_19678:844-1686(+)
MEDLSGSLPVFVVMSITPRVIGRVNSFPHSFHIANRYFHVIERLVISQTMTNTSRNQGVRLVLAHNFHKFLHIVFGYLSGSVEPDKFNRPVFTCDFLHLQETLFFEVIIKGCILSFFICCGAIVSARIGPVLIMRIIETKANPYIVTRLGKIFHHVTFIWSRIHNVEVVRIGMIHCKTIMMLACNYHILHPCILRQSRNRHGIEFHWVELFGHLLVFLGMDIRHLWIHDPFTNAIVRLSIHFVAQLRIQSPMNEHGIVTVLKTFSKRYVFGMNLHHCLAA